MDVAMAYHFRDDNYTTLCPNRSHNTYRETIVFTTLGILIGLLNIIGNGLIVFAFSTTKSLQKPRNVLLTNLACSDILYGLVAFPLYAVTEIFQKVSCKNVFTILQSLIIMLPILMNLNNIAAIAVERLIGIKFPFFYETHMTQKACYCLAMVSWLFGITRGVAITFVRLLSNSRSLVFLPELIIWIFLLVFSISVYVYLYIKSRLLLRRDKQFGIRHQESKAQAAVMIALVNGVFWLPVICFRLLSIINSDLKYIREVTFFSPYVGSCFNLVIYTYRLSDFRSVIKKIVLK